ncbi:MAG: peptide deformylase [Desulfovibrionaceae bacterium]|nr:peptide deformylase [Desulfovibrionaceae bacterium]
MKLPVSIYPDPVLRLRAEPIGEFGPEMQQLVTDMVETMYEDDGVGLAAPQVGKSLRLITVDPTGPKERKGLMVLVNPEIMEREGEVESEEGCLSVPDFKCAIRRSHRIRVRALDRDGAPVEFEALDYQAVIIQHEVDHLNGVLILDHASRLKRGIYDKKVRKLQRQREKGES